MALALRLSLLRSRALKLSDLPSSSEAACFSGVADDCPCWPLPLRPLLGVGCSAAVISSSLTSSSVFSTSSRPLPSPAQQHAGWVSLLERSGADEWCEHSAQCYHG